MSRDRRARSTGSSGMKASRTVRLEDDPPHAKRPKLHELSGSSV
jgi:hypothetical protein